MTNNDIAAGKASVPTGTGEKMFDIIVVGGGVGEMFNHRIVETASSEKEADEIVKQYLKRWSNVYKKEHRPTRRRKETEEMRTEDIERVAKALCPWVNCRKLEGDAQCIWDSLPDKIKRVYMEQAVAAMEAMPAQYYGHELAKRLYMGGIKNVQQVTWEYMLQRVADLAGASEFTKLRHANVTRQKEWDEGKQITLSYKGNELAGEIGELCNVLKKLERESLGIRGSRATVQQAEEEAADGIICLDLICAHLGIDLWEAVKKKFNKTSVKNNLATTIGE